MNDFITTYINTFKAGGFLMLPLACLGFYLFYFGISICIGLFKANSELRDNFSLMHKTLNVDVPRRIFFLKALSGVAPLVGLLGTVIGICACISASHESQTIADGISTALITTQTGLVIAIPSWIVAEFAESLRKKISIKFAIIEHKANRRAFR